MAKPLVFRFGGDDIAMSLTKVDRSKLYGYKEVEVQDERGRTCELATLAGDGRTVVGRGGTGIGYVSADGEWCDKSDLTPVDLDGKEIQPVASSFSAPIALDQRASLAEYLEHNIRLVYVLETDDAADELLAELCGGAIFRFPYSYRGGLEADAGFLLAGDDEHVFLAVGNPTNVRFIGLQQTAAMFEDAEDIDKSDMMDFDMI
jgi:hypothetical protein